MKPTVSIALLCLSLSLPWGTGRADEAGDFSSWTRRPHEPFSDGERAFRQAREMLLKDYVDDKLTEDDLYRAAVAGMIAGAGGRKWDKLLSPSEMAELHSDLKGEVVGIGIEIKFDSESGTTSVLGIIPGGPAEKAGLAPGDKILKIDGRSFKGMQSRDVVYSMRGKAGTPVSLTVLRDDRVLTQVVRREALSFAPVADALLDGNTGYLHIKTFNEKTPSLLHAALARIAAKSPRGLIIDLRGDEGGLFQQMLECAAMLLPKGSVIVTTVGRGGKETVNRTDHDPLLGPLPTVVLINGKTASSAEILAGALKQAGAKLVGTKTFGKWNVQRIAELPNQYALKMTVGVFKSPSGELLDGKGQEPDIEVDADPMAAEKAWRLPPADRPAADPQLRAASGLVKMQH